MKNFKTKLTDFFYSIPRVLFINFYRLVTRIRVINYKKIPVDRSVILAINHTTGADPIVLLSAVKKRIYFLAGGKNFGSRFTNFFMRKFANSIPVFHEQIARNTASFRELFRISRKKNIFFGIFPEGKLNKNNKLEVFQKGAAYFSYKTKIPIIPIYIHNLRKGVPDGSFVARSDVAEGIISIVVNTFRKIHVYIGDPIDPMAENIIKDFKDIADGGTYKKAIGHINGKLEEGFNELISEAGSLFVSGEPSGDAGCQDEGFVEDIRKVKP